MYSLLLLTALPGQFVENDQFPIARQHAAFEATPRIYHAASRSEGAAVVIGRKDGAIYLLTAAHLVPEFHAKDREKEDLRNVELYFYPADRPNRAGPVVIAKVRTRMPNEDLALLEARPEKPPAPLSLCPKDKRIFRFPMTVMTVGIIRDGGPDVKTDTVKRQKKVHKPDDTAALYWEADTPQGPGRSGGPMIDTRGYVIGIASGIQHGKGYYTSIDEIIPALREAGFGWLCP
jgi:S1-C subfamily serine protease